MTHKQHFLLLSLLFIIFTPLLFLSDIPSSAVSAAINEENLYGWAWSPNIGWISFNSRNCDTDGDGVLDRICGGDGNTSIGINYAVKRRNNSQIWGYAWSPNLGYMTTGSGVDGGWITFGPSRDNKQEITGLAAGDSVPVDSDSEKSWAYMETNNQLKGWARACSVFVMGCGGPLKPEDQRGGWDGWIKLSGKTTNNINYGVTRNVRAGDPFEYNNVAWGGGDNSNFLGWIYFNPTIEAGPFCGDGNKDPGENCSNCPSDYGVCGGGGGTWCGNGTQDPGENCFNCAIDVGSCSNEDDKCPDGSDKPNPVGVFEGTFLSCPIGVEECYPIQQIVGSWVKVTKIDKNKNLKWFVIPSGAKSYKYKWTRFSDGDWGSAQTSNIITGLNAGDYVSMKVTVSDSLQPSQRATTTCNSVLVYDPMEGTLGQVSFTVTPGVINLKFGSGNTKETTPLTATLSKTFANCSGQINGVHVESVTKGDSVITGSDLNSMIDTGILFSIDVASSKDFTLVLKDKTKWTPGNYRIKLGGNSPLANCQVNNPKAEFTINIQGAGGEFIEQ